MDQFLQESKGHRPHLTTSMLLDIWYLIYNHKQLWNLNL